MTVEAKGDFVCQECSHVFYSNKRYIIRYNSPDKPNVVVSTCPECSSRVEMPLEMITQRSVINPLCPKTTFDTVVRDRPLWV